MRWSLARKFALIMIMVFLAVALFASVVGIQLEEVKTLNQENREEWLELTAVIALTNDLFRLELAIEHEANSPDIASHARINASFYKLSNRIDRLEELQKSDAAISDFQNTEVAILQNVKQKIEKIEEEWKDSGKSINKLQSVIFARQLDRMLQSLWELVEVDTKEMNEGVLAIQTVEQRIDRMSIILLLVLSFFLCVLCIVFFYSFIRPVRNLHNMVIRMHHLHDYAHAMPSGQLLPDEVGALADSFSDMAEEITSFTNNLEKQVQDRTRDLIHSQKLAGIGRLASGVAHEINNPMAAIGACAEGLLRRFEKEEAMPKDNTVKEYLETIRDEVLRCKDITEKLLDFSKTRAPRREKTNIAALLTETTRLIKHSADKKNCEIQDQTTSDACWLECDPDQIKQVFLNLLLNAMDACLDGGIIQLKVDSTEDMIQIMVRDNGCGIAAKDISHIFEPFYSKKIGTGTGLGLSVSHGIVEAHAGTISVQSDGENQGSVLTVKLPIDNSSTT